MGHSQMMAESSCFNLRIIFQGGTRGGALLANRLSAAHKNFPKNRKQAKAIYRLPAFSGLSDGQPVPAGAKSTLPVSGLDPGVDTKYKKMGNPSRYHMHPNRG